MSNSDDAPLSLEARERISHFETDQLYRTIRTGIRCLTAALICYYGFQAVEALAGQNTNISIVMGVLFAALAELKVAIFIGLTGLSAAWAVVERTLRHRKVEYLQGRIKELEMERDQNRTSSNLTPKGKTNPRDQRR